MKSYCKNLYNYMAEPFETITETISAEDMEESIKNSIETMLLQNRIFSNVDTVKGKDTVTLSLKSTLPRYNKENLQLTVGLNLFQKDLEEQLIGQKTGIPFTVTMEGQSVQVLIEECRRLTVPDLTDELVRNLDIVGVTTVKQYRAYLRQNYIDLCYDGFVEWYGMQLFSDTLKKCQWEIDEEEQEAWYQRWAKVQQEERDFHNMGVMDGYEEIEREDADLIFHMALIYCLFTGTDHRTFDMDLSDPETLEKVRNSVLAPYKKYLKDKVVIRTEEEE